MSFIGTNQRLPYRSLVTSRRVRVAFDLFVGVFLLWAVSPAVGQRAVRSSVGLLPQAAKLSPIADAIMVGSEQREDDLPALAAAPGSLWLAWLTYSDRRDEIALRRYSAGTWGNLQYVPNTSGDSWFPQVAVDANSRVWAVWSQHDKGNWDLYARSFDPGEQAWGPLLRLTEHSGPDINHRVAGDQHGRIAVVWQGFRGRASNIYLKTLENGQWSDDVAVTRHAANDWDPAVGMDSTGTSWVVYDSYRNGNYDVYLTALKNGKTIAETTDAATPAFEARATVAVDRQVSSRRRASRCSTSSRRGKKSRNGPTSPTFSPIGQATSGSPRSDSSLSKRKGKRASSATSSTG